MYLKWKESWTIYANWDDDDDKDDVGIEWLSWEFTDEYIEIERHS